VDDGFADSPIGSSDAFPEAGDSILTQNACNALTNRQLSGARGSIKLQTSLDQPNGVSASGCRETCKILGWFINRKKSRSSFKGMTFMLE